MRPALAAVIGAAVAAAVLFTTSFQSAPVTSTWPAGKAIVNWLAWEDLPGGSVTIPAGGEFSLYTVPPDRWLVITEAELGDTAFWFFERMGSSDVRKFTLRNGTNLETHSISPRDVIGVAFQPGSELVVRNTSATQNVALAGPWFFRGYLTR